MTWRVELSEQVRRQLKPLDPGQRTRIQRFLVDRLATAEDPRRLGHSLQATLAGLWRYRIGDYRLICRIEDARRAVQAPFFDTTERYLRLALRAQSQSRATWEALIAIKNPPPVGYLRQTNIAHGPQQVNNGGTTLSEALPA
jgi:mRNA interferase RelE/StbE